ncbi:MAG: FAD-dependent oxidoreductase [Planctomycetes bacterium]|nr:FAD-dependent oxidoreductase [Planctomycetota bacterium]
MRRLTVAVLAAVLAAAPAGAARAAEVLVEAESFAELGGWLVDAQFMDIMGSPYLLAHGLGKPVAPARTQVEFPDAGAYRLWVRTKDWVPPHHPGTFKVVIDGVPAGVFGNHGKGWLWQDGGTVQIKGKKATIELVDLTGFDGRCDALFFTTDARAAPPAQPNEQMASWRRKLLGLPETPPSAGQFDLVVVGGGIAGTAAAVTAARLGCTVALVHDRPMLGGNASQEIRVHTGGAGGKVVDEVNANYNAAAAADPHPTVKFDERREKVVAAEKNIQEFLNWHVFRVQAQNKRIAGVDAQHTITGQQKRFAATVFLDSTGDGSVAAWAGAEFRMGREGRDEFGEKTAPEKPDKMTLGTSITWGTRETDRETAFPAVPWAKEVSKDLAASSGDWTWEYGHYLDTIQDAEEIRDHLLRAVYGSWSTAKNEKDTAKFARSELAWVAHVGGKRESRRIIGDYILTENDIVQTRQFPDGVATGTWSIDLHYPKGYDFRTYAQFGKVKPYPIPFRCLYSKDIENLMLAGRNISETHVALGSTRVMNTGGQMGVAVGAAAYLCKKHATTPRGVYQKHLPELLAIVKGEGEYQETLKAKFGPVSVPGGSAKPPPGAAAPAPSGHKASVLDAATTRCSDQFSLVERPKEWDGLTCVTIARGSTSAPAPAFAFEADKPVTVYLAVHERGDFKLPAGWEKTDLRVRWQPGTGAPHTDAVYRRDFPAGKVEIPGHTGFDGRYFGIPNMAVVRGQGGTAVKVTVPAAP